MTAMELTEQDLKAMRQMVRFEIRWALKDLYARQIKMEAIRQGAGGLVADAPPIDMKWVEEPVA